MRLGQWSVFAFGLALVLCGAVAHAAEPPSNAESTLSSAQRAELQAEYDKLFAELLQHPTDLDLMFTFAAVAARLGNYESAISTLERMLLLNRDLPRVK